MRRIFDLGPDTDAPFIALQHKRRQTREENANTHAENMKAVKAEREAIEQHRTFAETTATQLRPLVDMWNAAAPKDDKGQPILGADGQPAIDYDMSDAAFEANTGIKMDDYIRRRARRGATGP